MKKIKPSKFTKSTIKKVSTKIEEESAARRVQIARSIKLQTYLAIAVCVFVTLAFFAHHTAYFPLDLFITKNIQLFHPFWFDFLMKTISYIGYTPQVDVFVLLIVGLMFALGLRFEAVVSFGNALIITIINLLLKDLVGRPRPSIHLVRVFSQVGQSSFPSGHVMFYLAFFGYLWFLTFTRLKNSTLRLLSLLLLSSVIILIAPSRIYLGAHWASDVLGAYVFSSIWLVLLIQFHNWGKSRFFVKQ